MSRCTLVIANAGSGKTWTLANRVLRWVIESRRTDRGADPARILAVTFTRKAAGEILARIVSHAARGAAEGDAGARARREYEAVVGAATREEYADALAALCASMHRLQIGTIDGFFHRIASALPGEIGLPAEWTLGEEHELEELRARAAAEVLAADDADELVSLLERGEPKPSVTAAIAGLLGGPGFSPLDVYRATAPGGEVAIDRAFGWVERLAVPGDLSRESWDRAVADADALEATNGHWRKALVKLREALHARDFAALAKSGFLDAMRSGRAYQRLAMDGAFEDVGVRIAAHLRHALIADIARKLRGACAVLPRADAALARLQRSEGLFGFGDVSRGVAAAAGRSGSAVSDPAALRAALGADVRDLAIDEAQDTSVEQFAALRPLLAEVLGGARDGRFLLVGDPKQSIYGWRGGTPGLIARVEHDYAGALGPGEALTRSFRSSPLVMDFVNEVFADLSSDVLAHVEDEHRGDLVGIAEWARREGLPPEATESAFVRGLAQWRFARHESAKPDLAGRIVAYRCGKVKATATDPEREVAAHGCAALIAERLHREDPSRSVAILMRTNQEIADTIAELRARGVAASDEGRSTLLDSPAVAGAAEFLRLIDDPGDRIAHFMLSRGAMARATGLAPLEDHPTHDAALAAAAAFATARRAEIADKGLAAVLRALFEALCAQGLAARDADRLARVVAIAEESAERPCARPIDLLAAIEADKADGSSASGVRVMTVHRAKGLEFDEVILPALDQGWGQTGSDWGMLVVDPTKPPMLAGPLMNEDVRLWVPELRVLERDERRRGLLDDLSALYVALTRARQGVHLVMDHAQGGSFPTAAKLIAAALRRATARAGEGAFAGAPAFAEGFDAPFDFEAAARADACWTHVFGAMPAAAEAVPAAGDSITAPVAPLVRIVPRAAARATAPSEHGGGAKSGLWQFDPFADDDIALRGVLVHECFREVESVAALATAPARAALVARAARRAAVEKGEPVPAKLVGEAEALLARVAAGATGAALGAGPGIRVRTELPFVRDTADGLVHGRIDRLELELRDGRVAGARIVDFKTGAVGATGEAFEEKVRGYFGQLAGYAAAVAEMHALDPGAIRLALLFVDRDEVVERTAARVGS